MNIKKKQIILTLLILFGGILLDLGFLFLQYNIGKWMIVTGTLLLAIGLGLIQ